MKKLLAVIAIGIMLAGCSKDNPVDSGVTGSVQTEAMFSETSMYNTTLAVSSSGGFLADTGGCVHDSLRNLHMLDSLKVYLSLTDDQFTSLQSIGTTLFTRLTEIRGMVKDGTISRDSSRTLVKIARDEFVASVKLILTADQITLFDTWITLYWNKPEGGHGGHGGGHGGHGGGHGGGHK